MMKIRGILVAAAVALVAAPAIAAQQWECESRPLVGSPTYPGYGATEIDARANANAACRADHLVCYVDQCVDLAGPGGGGGDSVTIHGVTYYKGYIDRKVPDPVRVAMPQGPIPDTYDAVAAGKATPVKDDGQGSCGDCWAWARTSSLEAAALAVGPGLKLSEEDTTVNASDEYGCGGGMMDFNYELNHGVTLQSNCPFDGGMSACDAAPAIRGASMAYVGGSNGPTDQELMQAIYQYGSVAVTVAAGGNFDVDSGSDRMTDCGGRGIDHMVSLVGYRPAPGGGVEFKMKNSWGHGWGAEGYAYMARGCNELATGDQSAMVIWAGPTPPPPPPPPPPTQEWTCEAAGWFGKAHSGTGTTENAAQSAALKACKSAGGWFCKVTSCSQD